VNVRAARREDAAPLAAVARRAITISAASKYDADQIAVWSGSFTVEKLAELIDSTSVFVVEVDERIAGFASLLIADEQFEVDQLYVDPDFGGRGAARLAVDTVESAARGAGAVELWADASLLSSPVFEHFGYAVVERYEKARGAVSFPNTWLKKGLA
jgi:putative acetyltransferase